MLYLYVIAVYTLRATAFAFVACGAYALVCKLRKKPVAWKKLLAIFYLSALIQITVLRGGADWSDFWRADRFPVQWTPLVTTFAQAKLGAWPLIYHVVGNLAWFVPFGVILRKKPFWVALAAGALLSAAIEGMQWFLMTGMTDADDVLMNTLGTLIGFLLARRFPAPRPRKPTEERP